MACSLRRAEDRLDRRLARRKVGSEAALIADGGREPLLLQHLLQRVVGLRADPQRLGERGRADRHDHELLQIDRVGRVHAAVDDVHHRHGQRRRLLPAEMAEERHACVRRGRLRGRNDTARMAFAPSRPLFGVPSRSIMRRSTSPGRPRRARARLRRLSPTLRDRLRHALPAVGLAAVAQLDRLCTPVDAPEGTAARPKAPESSLTSASTVGFPRESRIWRA